jgi:hypothetical protein
VNQDGDGFPPDDGGSAESRAGFVPEFVKKMAVAGLGAIFMTEEGLRNLAGQLKLPKELLGVVLSQAEKTKDEIGRVVSDELRRFLQSEKLRQEFLRLLTGMTVEVTAQVRLVPAAKSEPLAETGTGSVPGTETTPPGAEALEQSEVVPQVVVTEVTARRNPRKP